MAGLRHEVRSIARGVSPPLALPRCARTLRIPRSKSPRFGGLGQLRITRCPLPGHRLFMFGAFCGQLAVRHEDAVERLERRFVTGGLELVFPTHPRQVPLREIVFETPGVLQANPPQPAHGGPFLMRFERERDPPDDPGAVQVQEDLGFLAGKRFRGDGPHARIGIHLDVHHGIPRSRHAQDQAVVTAAVHVEFAPHAQRGTLLRPARPFKIHGEPVLVNVEAMRRPIVDGPFRKPAHPLRPERLDDGFGAVDRHRLARNPRSPGAGGRPSPEREGGHGHKKAGPESTADELNGHSGDSCDRNAEKAP